MSEERICPNCGAALMPGDIFCGECGARMRAPEYDIAPDTSADDVSPAAVEEPLPEEPTAGQYVPPPPIERKVSDWTALRIIGIVVAAGFLLVSLCLCSFGGFALFLSEPPLTDEGKLLFATICCAPGVISGLLGIGAAYFAFRKR